MKYKYIGALLLTTGLIGCGEERKENNILLDDSVQSSSKVSEKFIEKLSDIRFYDASSLSIDDQTWYQSSTMKAYQAEYKELADLVKKYFSIFPYGADIPQPVDLYTGGKPKKLNPNELDKIKEIKGKIASAYQRFQKNEELLKKELYEDRTKKYLDLRPIEPSLRPYDQLSWYQLDQMGSFLKYFDGAEIEGFIDQATTDIERIKPYQHIYAKFSDFSVSRGSRYLMEVDIPYSISEDSVKARSAFYELTQPRVAHGDIRNINNFDSAFRETIKQKVNAGVTSEFSVSFVKSLEEEGVFFSTILPEKQPLWAGFKITKEEKIQQTVKELIKSVTEENLRKKSSFSLYNIITNMTPILGSTDISAVLISKELLASVGIISSGLRHTIKEKSNPELKKDFYNADLFVYTLYEVNPKINDLDLISYELVSDEPIGQISEAQFAELLKKINEAVLTVLGKSVYFKDLYEIMKSKDKQVKDGRGPLNPTLSPSTLSSSFRKGLTGVDASQLQINGASPGKIEMALPISINLKGKIDGAKSTAMTSGSAAYKLGNTVFGVVHAYANKGEGFESNSHQFETSVAISQSIGNVFIEGQAGYVGTQQFHTVDMSGNRYQLSIGFDTQYVSPFLQVAYRDFGTISDKAAYIGAEVSIERLKADIYNLDMSLNAKVGRDSKSEFTGSLEWSASLNLNSGVMFKTDMTLGTNEGSTFGLTANLNR